MKVYHIFLTDYPEEHIKAICKNVQEAKEKARRYIEVWQLDADILKIEYVGKFEEV